MQPDGGLPVAPSAIAAEGQAYTMEGPKPFGVPRALEIDEIPGVVGQFADGARVALAAGFDGVEIHGANGYLIDQFLRDGSNRRTDAYGGPPENRVRFLQQVTDAVAGVWGADRVGVRLSPTGSFNTMSDSDPAATFGHAARELDRYGLAYLHVVEPLKRPAGMPAPVAPLLRSLFKGPFILNGGYDQETGNAALAAGEADLISFGVLFLANPDLPERFAERAPLNAADQGTFYTGRREGVYRLSVRGVAGPEALRSRGGTRGTKKGTAGDARDKGGCGVPEVPDVPGAWPQRAGREGVAVGHRRRGRAGVVEVDLLHAGPDVEDVHAIEDDWWSPPSRSSSGC